MSPGVASGVEVSKVDGEEGGRRRRRRVKLWFWIRKSAIVLLPEHIGPAIPMNMIRVAVELLSR